MNTALYRRRAANINSTIGNGSTQPCICFKQFKEKVQNYNGNKLLLFVDEKISCALDHDSLITLSQPRGAKSHIKKCS